MDAPSIVSKMMENDAFSRWLGIRILDTKPGACILQMTITNQMVNGFGIAHGGISYAFADSALAFASNGHGRHCVSIDTSINHITPLQEGDVIMAFAKEDALKNKFGFYTVEIKKDDTIIALFKGTVFRSDKEWFESQ
jgi:acyl-CoA thioesterase